MRPAAASRSRSSSLPLGQFAGLRGHAPGDLGKLLTVGQLLLDHGERLLQLDGDLNRRREDDDGRPSLLAGLYLVGQRLDDFWIAEELVLVPNMRED